MAGLVPVIHAFRNHILILRSSRQAASRRSLQCSLDPVERPPPDSMSTPGVGALDEVFATARTAAIRTIAEVMQSAAPRIVADITTSHSA
jgi:hypothetical protein